MSSLRRIHMFRVFSFIIIFSLLVACLVENFASCTVEKVFFVFYPHTLTFCCNRLTDSNKGCEGKCEGSFFTLTLTLTTSPHAHYSSGRNASCLSRGFNGRQGSSGIPAV